MMDGKKTRMAAGALGIGAALLVAIATHEGYRGEVKTGERRHTCGKSYWRH